MVTVGRQIDGANSLVLIVCIPGHFGNYQRMEYCNYNQPASDIRGMGKGSRHSRKLSDLYSPDMSLSVRTAHYMEMYMPLEE